MAFTLPFLNIVVNGASSAFSEIGSHASINTCMKINEVSNTPQTYMATVRVVLCDGSTTARTTVTADTFQQARLILTRIYGEGNVLGLSQQMSESPRTSQIQADAANGVGALHCKHPKPKIDSVQPSTVAEMGARTRVLSPQELQVKSLSDRAKQLNQQAKQLKARQAVQKAQQNLSKTMRSVSPQ